MPNQALTTMRIMWASLMFSVCIMLVVVFIVPHEPVSAPAFYVPLFAAVALWCALLSFVLPKRMYVQGAKNQEIPLSPSQSFGGMPGGMFQDAGPARKLPAHPDEARRHATVLFQTQFILSLALSEAVALFGFMLGHLGFSPVQFVPFFVVSLALMALRFPTEERIVAMFEAATGVYVGSQGRSGPG